ncbi:MAG: hypothetical protein AAF528_02905 [Cyanobacteria bacterium P01_C01_bin.121]
MNRNSSAKVRFFFQSSCWKTSLQQLNRLASYYTAVTLPAIAPTGATGHFVLAAIPANLNLYAHQHIL